MLRHSLPDIPVNIIRNIPDAPLKEEKEIAEKLHQKGWTARRVAMYLHLPEDTVRRWIDNHSPSGFSRPEVCL